MHIKRYKKIIIALISVFAALSIFVGLTPVIKKISDSHKDDISAATLYGGGDGSESNPYIISSTTHSTICPM